MQQLMFFKMLTPCGCFFHLSSSIWKHVRLFGMQAHYMEDEEFAVDIRKIPVLAFVPPDQVIDTFKKY